MTQDGSSKEWRGEQKERQDKLNECLETLCNHEIQSHDELIDIANRLLEVYSDPGFRHRYSEVLSVVHNLDGAEDLDGADRVQYVEARGTALAQGLRNLWTHTCTEECGQIEECPVIKLQRDQRLDKLYDHANLEARRAGYEAISALETEVATSESKRLIDEVSIGLERACDKISESINEANQATLSAKQAEQEALRARKAAEKASKKAKRLQAETVSVLGIFSAIVLAFNASVTFTTSAIAAVDTEPPFRVAFIVSIVGLVLFNCLYGAFSMIYRMVRPDGSPAYLLNGKRVAGIEVIFASVVIMLGGLACLDTPWLMVTIPGIGELPAISLLAGMSLIGIGVGVTLIARSRESGM